MTIAVEYCAGCSIATMAAHHPPVDSPMALHEARSVFTRKVRATHSGTSSASHVSS